MAIAHLLEDFGTALNADSPGRTLGEEELEDFRLSAFEQGYSAGWDDALAAQAQDQARISSALAANLEDLSFTYHEAVNQLLLTVEPVFRSLMETVLPDAILRSHGGLILEELQKLAQDRTAAPVRLLVPPGAGAALEELLPDNLTMPVDVIEDQSLEPGQADLRVGSVERELDCSQILKVLGEALDAFFYQTSEEAKNG